MSSFIRLTLAAVVLSLAQAAVAGDVAELPTPKVNEPVAERPEGANKALEKTVKVAVQKKLTAPLAAKEEERSRYSRARMPAQERRVRVLDAKAKTDADGKAFVAFAVDARHGYDLGELGEKEHNPWRKDTITGCVYVDGGEVFVDMGKEIRPAAVMLGKKAKPASPTTCKAADGTQVAVALP